MRAIFLASFVLVVSASIVHSDSVESLTRTLNNTPKDSKSNRELVVAKNPVFGAIKKLESIGSVKAVEALTDYLRHENGHPEMKRQTLMALGRIGTVAAVGAISDFEVWAEARPKHWSEVTLSPTDYPSHHYAPYTHSILAEATARDGTVYALFAAPIYSPAEFWIGKKSGSENRLVDCVLLNIEAPNRERIAELHKSGQIKLSIDNDSDSFQIYVGDGFPYFVPLEGMKRDTDGDGLCDIRERRIGTSLAHPDSDADGVPDAKDGNPLTPPIKATDDAALIRQAVFLLFYGVSESHFALFQWKNIQEYRGYSGPVLMVPAVITGCVNFDISVSSVEGDHATAKFKDYQGPLSSSENSVELRKIHGHWVATGYRISSIS